MKVHAPLREETFTDAATTETASPGAGGREPVNRGDRRQEARVSEVLSSTFVLAVCDLDAAVRFYVDKLDFVEDFRVDGWAFLSRGACRLRLGHCPGVIPMSQVTSR